MKNWIPTRIKCENMRELLLLCTQSVPFTFDNETYTQVDGFMMGSPLGALFANIYMCELEDTIIPKLEDKMCSWTRYVCRHSGSSNPVTKRLCKENRIAFIKISNSLTRSKKRRRLPSQMSFLQKVQTTLKQACVVNIQIPIYV